MSEEPTWHDVAEHYNDWDPSIRPHVERQLTQQGIELPEAVPEQNVTDPFEQSLAVLRERSETTRRLHYDDIASSLATETYTADQLHDMVRTVTHLSAVNNDARRREGDTHTDAYGGILGALTQADPAILREAYQTHGLFRALITTNMSRDTMPHAGAQVLGRIYDVPNVLDLKLQQGPHQDDPLVRDFVERPQFFAAAINDMVERYNTIDADSEDAADLYIRDEATRFLEATQLPHNIADDIMFHALPRLHYLQDSTRINTESMVCLLDNIGEYVSELGVANVERLHRQFGITGFDYIPLAQARDMLQILDGEPETIQRYQDGDSTVVLVDSRGDYNAALQQVGPTFQSDAQRTLTFEMRQPSDPLRMLALLDRRGINPATVVLAAHGAPGKIAFGAIGAGSFLYKNHGMMTASRRTTELSSSAALNVIAEKYMQDSRGIDLPDDTIGRRRVIMLNCSSDAPATVLRGNKPGQESFAESVILSAQVPELDVYAAKESFSLKPTKQRSLRFVKPDTDLTVPVSRLSLRPDGTIERSSIDAVPLAKTER